MPTPIRQFNTQTHYLADGVTTAWPFAFTGGYIDPTHVRVQTRSTSGTLTEVTVNPATDLIGEYQLRITPPVTAGYEIRIYRATPRDLPLVDFTDGSQLPEVNLDIVARQSIFVAAESADWLGVTSTEDLTGLATAAGNSAAAAAASAAAAAASVTSAGSQAIAAAASAAAALASQNAAVVSAGAAASSAADAAATAAALGTSTGAAAIGYTASTPATAGTVAARLKREIFLSTYADPTGVLSADAGLTAALTDTTQFRTLILDGDFKLTASGVLNNKSNIAIAGNGRLFLSGAASDAMVLRMQGTCDDILFHGFRVEGDNDAAKFQTGVGNFSGQTLTNIRYINMTATRLNVGLSFTGNGGLCDKWFTSGCIIHDLVGVNSGQGYGLHIDNASNGTAIGVIVRKATRHSIYHGRGFQNKIIAPTVVDHRLGVANSSFRAAISISRSSGIQIIGGEVRDAYDGQLEIGADSISNAASVRDIQIADLRLIGRKNAVYGVQIGEQAVPGTYTTSDIMLRLQIEDDHVQVGAVPAIIVNNGNGISFAGTRILRTGVNGTTKLLALGNAPYISADSHCEDTLLESMEFIARGSNLSDVRAIDLDADICVNTSRHKIRNNSYTGVTSPVYFNATNTNPNLWAGALRGEGAWSPPSLAAGANTSATIGVTGARINDRATVTYSQSFQGLTVSASVTSAGIVTLRVVNNTGATVTLASGTLYAHVISGDS